MKIKESKNLTYQRSPLIRGFETVGRIEPSKCLLESFDLIDDKIELHFKNGKESLIAVKNPQGKKELDLIFKKMPHFIDKSYEDILNMNI